MPLLIMLNSKKGIWLNTHYVSCEFFNNEYKSVQGINYMSLTYSVLFSCLNKISISHYELTYSVFSF